MAFVRTNGLVLESARGPVPNLAQFIAGERIRGSWWAHPKANEIFILSRYLRSCEEILVCRLINGKVTYVHRRLWPAIVHLADKLGPERVAAIREVHTPSGKHRAEMRLFPDWVPEDVKRASRQLTEEEAISQLPAIETLLSAKRN